MKANQIVHAPLPAEPIDSVELDYDARFLRRKLLRTVSGAEVLVDLPKVTALKDGDSLQTEAGLIRITAAAEPVLVVTGDLPKLAWHIGNRHTPCQIEPFFLVIRDDHVLRSMLIGLGANITDGRQPFIPEGGAYGAAQVMGHDHGNSHHHHHGDASDHHHHHHHHG